MPGDPGDPLPNVVERSGARSNGVGKITGKRGRSIGRMDGNSKERKMEGCAEGVKAAATNGAQVYDVFGSSVSEDSASVVSTSKVNVVNNNNLPASPGNDDIELFYDDTHPGPFMVYIDTITKNSARQPFSVFDFSRHVKFLEVRDVICVTKIGYGRGKIVFKTAQAANAFVTDQRIIGAGYQPRIFAHFLSKWGIIFPVEEDVSEDEMREHFQSEIPILKIQRVQRKEGDDLINTKRVKILFKGLTIPDNIEIYGCAFMKVRHFIPFAQCYRCYRYNHFSKHCKQQQKTCSTCFTIHDVGVPCAPAPVKCSNCKDNHKSTDKNCPARTKAFNIKRVMTIENLSYNEAKTKYPPIFRNSFYLLDEESNGEFPSLPQPRNNSSGMGHRPTPNNTQESSSYFHRIQSYSRVAKNNANRIREEENAKRTQQQHREALDQGASYSLPNGSLLSALENQKTTEFEKVLSIITDLLNKALITPNVVNKESMNLFNKIKDAINSSQAQMDLGLMNKSLKGQNNNNNQN